MERIVSLMDLYAQNNQFSKLVEINNKWNLPKLMVVNFCGNTFCEVYNYHLYAVYLLCKLKVRHSLKALNDYCSAYITCQVDNQRSFIGLSPK